MNTLKENLEVIKFSYHFTKEQNIPVYAAFFFHALSEPLPAVFSVWFAAKITALISNEETPHTILLNALIGVALIFLLTILKRVGEHFYLKKIDVLTVKEKAYVSDIISKKDFSVLEKTDFQILFKTYDEVASNYGNSVIRFYFMFLTTVISGLCGLIFSLLIILPTLKNLLTFNNSTFITSWKPTVITIICIVLFGILMGIIGNHLAAFWTKQHEKTQSSYAIFVYWLCFTENYKQGKDIKVYHAQNLIQQEYDYWQEKGLKISRTTIKTIMPMQRLIAIFTALIVGTLYCYIALRATSGSLDADNLVAIIGAIPLVVNGITQLSNLPFLTKTLCKYVGYLKRILDYDSDRYMGTIPVEKRDDNDFLIEFKDVSFKYPNTDTYALRHVSMQFKIGEHLAFVGANGSGKTTFIKLLCRLYDPTEGEILLNGINIKKYDMTEYMSLFSVVFQDFSLFAVPLSQNVSTSVDYDKEKLWQCLEEAGIADRVKNMPQQENTVLYKELDDNGIEISGGEEQKIAIARALYRDAPFVVLDEPTASLDPVSEFEIYERFNDFTKDKTAVYISHRLSSCRFCDNIMVFDKGQIVQFGTHESLLADENGKYSQLWNSQAKYYVSKVE